MKILFSILGYEKNNQESVIENVIRNTWGRDVILDGHELQFYYGVTKTLDSERFSVRGDKIYCNSAIEHWDAIHKTLEYFTYIKDLNFDLMYRCCNGTYIRLPMFYEKIQKTLLSHQINNLYCGPITGNLEKHGTKYVSGSGMLISKDIIVAIAKIYEDIGLNGCKKNVNVHMDDVIIGGLITKILKISPIAGTKIEMIPKYSGDYHYHFGQSPELMHALHSHFKGNIK